MLYGSKSNSKKRSKPIGKRKKQWKNPILEGQAYWRIYRSGEYPTYEIIANKFGVTRARICQMIALAKRLPNEIIDVFSDREHADKLQHITERKLRQLTLMKTDAEKIAAFEKLMRT